MEITIQGHQLPSLFGNGIVGSAMNGLIRIPAFLANCAAVMVVGELALRALSVFLGSVGFQPNENSWLERIGQKINLVVDEFRPYKDPEVYSTLNLLARLVAFAAISVLVTELARVVAGPTPSIYNKVLTFLGPIRFDGGAYWDNVSAML